MNYQKYCDTLWGEKKETKCFDERILIYTSPGSTRSITTIMVESELSYQHTNPK